MKLGFQEYCVAYCDSKIENVLDIDQKEYTVIKNNWDSWSADPFIFIWNDDIYIFAEVWKYSAGKGAIGYCKWDGEKKKFSRWKIVIQEKFHLSYPNIFIYKDQIMLCPESSGNGEIYLYTAVAFPEQWEKYCILSSEGKFLDTTFLRYSESKNLGVTYEVRGSKEILRIFKISHGKAVFENEEKIRQTSNKMRPGGNFIIEENRIYRVCQLGEPYYGRGIIIKEFSICSDGYCEKPLKEFTSDNFNVIGLHGKKRGVHTFNKNRNFSVIDVRFERICVLPRVLRLGGKVIRTARKVNSFIKRGITDAE
ncbi:MAG: hypothetical protein HFH67_12290 [Lachnospiraceae bacterium]|nr:hypothetical protein [Lachnospiraceae bacterium]